MQQTPTAKIQVKPAFVGNEQEALFKKMEDLQEQLKDAKEEYQYAL